MEDVMKENVELIMEGIVIPVHKGEGSDLTISYFPDCCIEIKEDYGDGDTVRMVMEIDHIDKFIASLLAAKKIYTGGDNE